MLSNDVIKKLLTLCAQQEVALQSYNPESSLYKIEANLTIFIIKSILLNPPNDLDKQLTSILQMRWKRIQDTNGQYLHDFTNPANTLCISVAHELSAATKKNYLCLLMPSLTEVGAEEYTSSSYMDDDVELKEIILSDCNERIINVPDVLSASLNDGVLKHNSLFNQKAQELSYTEIPRFLSRHPSVQEAFDSITAFVLFKLEGDTAGAALNRLINGLRDGGTKRKTTYTVAQFNSTEFNSGMDANVAIVAFAEYLATLDSETHKQLMSAAKTDRDNANKISTNTVSTYWQRLMTPRLGERITTIYCVELIADGLEDILENNPGLYELVSCQGASLVKFAQLNETVTRTQKVMLEQLATVQIHSAYPQSEKRLEQYLLIAIEKAQLSLGTDELKFIIQRHLAEPDNSDRNERISSIFKQNHCAADEYKKLSPEEQAVYFKFNKPAKKTSVAANSSSLFNHSKRKMRANDEAAQDDIVQQDEEIAPPAKQRRVSVRDAHRPSSTAS